MKDIKPTDTHNFALVGHAGDGKTTVGEALLYAAKATNTPGSVTPRVRSRPTHTVLVPDTSLKPSGALRSRPGRLAAWRCAMSLASNSATDDSPRGRGATASPA